MKILITSGATREPIDSVRYISNVSTGATGSFLCDELMGRGSQIVFLAGEGSVRPKTGEGKNLKIYPFSSSSDLNGQLSRILREEHFDGVIHLAAVSDYSLIEPWIGKMGSDKDVVELKLKRNPKILSSLKGYNLNPRCKFVAFKLTDSISPSDAVIAVKKIFDESPVDIVIHNDMNDYRKGNRVFTYYESQMQMQVNSVSELASTLFKCISEHVL